MRLLSVLLALPLFAASPARILIAYHSQSGNTAKMAKAIRDGAASVAGTEIILKPVADVTPDDMKTANGILLGSPVHMHNISVESMQFLERLTTVLGKEMGEGRTAGVFCTGGAPALGKEMSRLEAIATFLELRFVVIGGLEPDSWGNLGPQGTTLDPDRPGLSDRELAAARRSGERFARLTKQFLAK